MRDGRENLPADAHGRAPSVTAQSDAEQGCGRRASGQHNHRIGDAQQDQNIATIEREPQQRLQRALSDTPADRRIVAVEMAKNSRADDERLMRRCFALAVESTNTLMMERVKGIEPSYSAWKIGCVRFPVMSGDVLFLITY